jgi:hypothetical protein
MRANPAAEIRRFFGLAPADRALSRALRARCAALIFATAAGLNLSRRAPACLLLPPDGCEGVNGLIQAITLNGQLTDNAVEVGHKAGILGCTNLVCPPEQCISLGDRRIRFVR